jgi:hypothetical protein
MAEFEKMCQAFHLTPEQREGAFLHLRDVLPQMGKMVAEARQLAKRQRTFTAIAGADGLKAVTKAKNRCLDERLESKDPKVRDFALKEADALDQKVRSTVKRNLIINWSLVFIGILGALTGIAALGLFATPVGWALAACILTVILVVMMGGLDLYSWKEGLNVGPPGKYDKVLSVVLIVLLLASIGVTGGLAGALGLSMIAAASLMGTGALGVGFLAFNHYKICQKEKKWKDLQVSLETVTADKLKLLPKEERERLFNTWKICNSTFRHSWAERQEADLALKKHAIKRASKAIWNAYRKGEALFEEAEHIQKLYQDSLATEEDWTLEAEALEAFITQKNYLLDLQNETRLQEIRNSAIHSQKEEEAALFETLRQKAQTLLKPSSSC